MARPRAKLEEDAGGLYWAAGAAPRFFSSGCALLDCVLGGGWAMGRIVNLVGDKSTGKTQLAIEACANFAREVPEGLIEYKDLEASFDLRYAQTIGLPADRVSFSPDVYIDTVEGLFKWLDPITRRKVPTLIVVDSLDALSDVAEMEREFGKSSMGMAKPKLMSELFRRLNQPLKRTGSCVMILSQVRDNVGVTFGKKDTRAGGRALDFFAEQTLWLYPRGKITRDRNEVKRVVGVKTLARMEKSKVGRPWREVEFPILFDYGVDDIVAAVNWLEDVKRPEELGAPVATYLKRLSKLDSKGYQEARAKLGVTIRRVWEEVEKDFAPPRGKYT